MKDWLLLEIDVWVTSLRCGNVGEASRVPHRAFRSPLFGQVLGFLQEKRTGLTCEELRTNMTWDSGTGGMLATDDRNRGVEHATSLPC